VLEALQKQLFEAPKGRLKAHARHLHRDTDMTAANTKANRSQTTYGDHAENAERNNTTVNGEAMEHNVTWPTPPIDDLHFDLSTADWSVDMSDLSWLTAFPFVSPTDNRQ
jgi:hypothetical protein